MKKQNIKLDYSQLQEIVPLYVIPDIFNMLVLYYRGYPKQTKEAINKFLDCIKDENLDCIKNENIEEEKKGE